MWSVYTRRTTPEQKFSFQDLLDLQEQVLNGLRGRGGSEGALLFAEVSPTVTLGARQLLDENQNEALKDLRARLDAQGIALQAGERGGKETWHGPGQWVGFVVAPLAEFTGDPRGVRKAVCRILDHVLEVVRAYDPSAKIEEDARLGIWSARGKLVSVGIKIRDGYVTSGFALNCFPHETSFFQINPCGLVGARPDFLFADRVPENRWNAEFESLPERLFAEFQQKNAKCPKRHI